MGNGLSLHGLQFLRNVINPPTLPPSFLITSGMAIKHSTNDADLRGELEGLDKKEREARVSIKEAKRRGDRGSVRESYALLNSVKEQQQRALKEKVPREVRERARQEMIESAKVEKDIDCVRNYNFGLCGQSGTGKSSLINALRYVEDNTQEAADIGIIECTTSAKHYVHPKWRHVWMWDIPGTNTLEHPEETYFADEKLYAFDCLLIVSSDRFLESDMNLALAAFYNEIPVAFVRTKSDMAIRNQVRGNPMPTLEASKILRQKVRDSLEVNLQTVGLQEKDIKSIPLFIVSSPSYTKPTIYHIGQDKSLNHMDEKKLYVFISTSLVRRNNSITHA